MQRLTASMRWIAKTFHTKCLVDRDVAVSSKRRDLFRKGIATDGDFRDPRVFIANSKSDKSVGPGMEQLDKLDFRRAYLLWCFMGIKRNVVHVNIPFHG